MKFFILSLLCGCFLALSAPTWSQSDASTSGENPPPAPPKRVPPPPPNIQPPSLPPNLKPPQFRPPEDAPREKQGNSIEAPEERELVRLERFLTMPQERLTALRRAIERVEKMSPEEKDALLKRIREIKSMSQQKRREFLKQFEGLSRSQRRGLAAIYYAASPDEKEEIRSKLTAANTAEKKQAFVNALIENNQEFLENLPQPRRLDSSNPSIMRKRHRAPGEGQSPPSPQEDAKASSPEE